MVDAPQSQASPSEMEQKEERACSIYAWSASLDRLEPKIWKYVSIPFYHSFFFIFDP
jgi:hypothetical protein